MSTYRVEIWDDDPSGANDVVTVEADSASEALRQVELLAGIDIENAKVTAL